MYSYQDTKKNTKEITLENNQQKLVNQADIDFNTSNKHIKNEEFYIWRSALKAYHLSTYDRKVQLGTQNWKQNISIGLIRSFVDILVAAIQEKPLTFIGTAINKKGFENKDNIIKTLNYISDISGFHNQLKDTMTNGLIIGEIAMRVGYKKTNKSERYVSVADGDIIVENIETEEKNYPYATNVSIFNLFPDPYSGNLRYVTERDVVSYDTFIETFGHTIRSKKNTSPFKNQKFIELLPINPNGADFEDYGNIVNQIHEKVNTELSQKDAFLTPSKMKISSVAGQQVDRDPIVIEGLIEFKSTWYKGRLIIVANNYPVYIGPNPFGFIPYVIKAANQTKARFGEGIPYMLKGLEDVGNSFINNYFDSARSLANPTLVVQKNLMINDTELEDGTPGGILYTEDNQNGNAVYRLDKGGLNDFGIMSLINQIASQITGISEYDLGRSARERTATGALAVSQSSQKRLSPYVSNFLDAISIIAGMWLAIIKKYWGAEQMIYILDGEGKQTWEAIKKTGIMGGVNISLEAEGIFGANEELKHKKILDLYNTLAPSGFAQSPEMAKEIIKTAGYNPSKFITEPGQGVIPKNSKDITNVNNQTNLPGQNQANTTGDILGGVATPNVNLGNKGQGQK